MILWLCCTLGPWWWTDITAAAWNGARRGFRNGLLGWHEFHPQGWFYWLCHFWVGWFVSGDLVIFYHVQEISQSLHLRLFKTFHSHHTHQNKNCTYVEREKRAKMTSCSVVCNYNHINEHLIQVLPMSEQSVWFSKQSTTPKTSTNTYGQP